METDQKPSKPWAPVISVSLRPSRSAKLRATTFGLCKHDIITMETKHTPGPWDVEIDGTCSAAWPHITAPSRPLECPIAELPALYVLKEEFNHRAETYQENPDIFEKAEIFSENVANARLIAAAPDLLAACERFLNPSDKGPRLEDMIRAAITKATVTI